STWRRQTSGIRRRSATAAKQYCRSSSTVVRDAPSRQGCGSVSAGRGHTGEVSVNGAGVRDNSPSGAELETRVANGLYTLGIEMSGAKSGHATGVAVLHD